MHKLAVATSQQYKLCNANISVPTFFYDPLVINKYSQNDVSQKDVKSDAKQNPLLISVGQHCFNTICYIFKIAPSSFENKTTTFLCDSFKCTDTQLLFRYNNNTESITIDRFDFRASSFASQARAQQLALEIKPNEFLESKNELKMHLMSGGNGQAAFVDNFWTSSQCQTIIDSCAKIFVNISGEYPDVYRNSERAVIRSPTLSQQLWKQIKNKSKILDHFKDTKPYGFGIVQGAKWEPIAINSIFRVSRYKEGQFFKRHRDVRFCQTNSCTVLTCLIYLNQNFKGGQTKWHFTRSDDDTYEDVQMGAQTGLLVVFPHGIEHEGLVVTKGTKYILRADVVYQQIAVLPFQIKDNHRSLLVNPAYYEVIYLYRESVLASHRKEGELATRLFLQASEAEQKASAANAASPASTTIVTHDCSDQNEVKLSNMQQTCKISNNVWELVCCYFSFTKGKCNDILALQRTCRYYNFLAPKWFAKQWDKQLRIWFPQHHRKFTTLGFLPLSSDLSRGYMEMMKRLTVASKQNTQFFVYIVDPCPQKTDGEICVANTRKMRVYKNLLDTNNCMEEYEIDDEWTASRRSAESTTLIPLDANLAANAITVNKVLNYAFLTNNPAHNTRETTITFMSNLKKIFESSPFNEQKSISKIVFVTHNDMSMDNIELLDYASACVFDNCYTQIETLSIKQIYGILTQSGPTFVQIKGNEPLIFDEYVVFSSTNC